MICSSYLDFHLQVSQGSNLVLNYQLELISVCRDLNLSLMVSVSHVHILFARRLESYRLGSYEAAKKQR